MKKIMWIVYMCLSLLILLFLLFSPYGGGFELHFSLKKAALIEGSDKIILTYEREDNRVVVLYEYDVVAEVGEEKTGSGCAIIEKKFGILYKFEQSTSGINIHNGSPFVYDSCGRLNHKKDIFAIKTANDSQIKYIAIGDLSKHEQFSLSEARANPKDFIVVEVKQNYALWEATASNGTEIIVRGFDSKGNLVAEQRDGQIAKYMNKPNKSINKTGVEKIRITTTSYDQIIPYIDGNRIFWEGERNGKWDISMYDLYTNKVTHISTDGSDFKGVSIYGNMIAWQDNRKGNYDIYIYDISTKKERQITTNGNDQMFPKIDGNRIVYEDNRNGNVDIYMYDLSTNIETQITTKGTVEMSPSISGNRIVWEDEGDIYAGEVDPKIYMYDLSTKSVTQISKNDSAQYGPMIDGNRIVWADSLGGFNTIFLYDLITKQESKITQKDNLIHGLYRIDGNRIVWEDDRTGKYNIYIYDLITKKETEIPINGLAEFNYSISGNSIVFSDDWNLEIDIYLYDMTNK